MELVPTVTVVFAKLPALMTTVVAVISVLSGLTAMSQSVAALLVTYYTQTMTSSVLLKRLNCWWPTSPTFF
jgi:hypothetical protein